MLWLFEAIAVLAPYFTVASLFAKNRGYAIIGGVITCIFRKLIAPLDP